MRLGAAKADQDAAAAALAAAEAQLSVAEASSRSGLKVARGGLDQAAAVAGTVRAAIAMADADLAADLKRSLVELELKATQALHEKRAISDAELDAQRSAFDQAPTAETLGRARLMSANASVANSDGTVTAAREAAGSGGGAREGAGRDAQVALASARVSRARRERRSGRAEPELRARTRGGRGSRGAAQRRAGSSVSRTSADGHRQPRRPLGGRELQDRDQEHPTRATRASRSTRTETRSSTPWWRACRLARALASPCSRRQRLGNFTKVVQRVPVLLRLDPVPAISMRPA